MKWEELLCPARERVSTSCDGADLRTEFEKDYHRIISSASFRRLQDKTQVYPLDRSDYIRTRLTHSLEVSSFAASLGRSAGVKVMREGKDPAFTEDMCSDASSILQCAGLIHDIGNPPFGHFTENAIREWFLAHLGELNYHGVRLTELLCEQMCQDFYHIEGNAQALRLVTRLHYLLDEHGMNLTYGLLSAIIKYPTSSLEIDPESTDSGRRKMGYYYAENALFQNVSRATGTRGRRNPLTSLLEAADDIAYRTVDIEDAFIKKFISYEELRDELRIIKAIPFGDGRFDPAAYLQELYKRGLKKDAVCAEVYAVKNWVVRAQNILLGCATDSFADHYEALMDGSFKRNLFCGTKGEELAALLGEVAYRHVFSSEPIIRMQKKEKTVIGDLLDYLVPRILQMSEDGEEEFLMRTFPFISDNYVRAYLFWSKGKTDAERVYLRLLLVTDYICGMTDSFAVRLHGRLISA